ncbi:MAG: hypothetical protein OCC49_17585 [Fibrobacterales bacterium]
MSPTNKLGTPKDLDSITLNDVLENKVWVWTWEVNLDEDYDESWQLPIIGLDDISSEFSEPVITLKVKDTEIYASGTFDYDSNTIFGISIWENDNWVLLRLSSLSEPISFISLVKIDGKENLEFQTSSKLIDDAPLLEF